jgi:hypothetical protein
MKTISYSLLVLLVSSGFQLSYADDCISWNNDFSGKINLIAGDSQQNIEKRIY